MQFPKCKDPKNICLTTTTTRKTNSEYNPHQYTSTLNIIENTEEETSNKKLKLAMLQK